VEAGVTPERVRVRQVTLTRDSEGRTAGNVVLNDRFLEADVRQQRRIAAIQGGYGVPGEVTPGGVGNDILAPGPVTGLSGASQNYVQPDGTNRAQISLDWPDVTTNADGTAASDISHYEVHRRKVGDTTWTLIAEVDTSFWSGSPYFGGEGWEFRVRAVDQVFNRGAFSAVVQVTTATDAAGPVKPSLPVIDARLGIVQVTWDGKASTGGSMDADFAAVEVHVGTVSGFTPARGDSTTLVGTLDRAGFVLVSDLPYNATRYVRLLPLDRSGNVGTVSDEATATVTPLVSGDVPQGTIKALQLDANAVTADKLDAGAITGKLLTGMVIQTRAEANRGIKLDGGLNQLKAYDAAGNQTFLLDGTSGDLSVLGEFQTSTDGSGQYAILRDGSLEFFGGGGGSITRASAIRSSTDFDRDLVLTGQWVGVGSAGGPPKLILRNHYSYNEVYPDNARLVAPQGVYSNNLWPRTGVRITMNLGTSYDDADLWFDTATDGWPRIGSKTGGPMLKIVSSQVQVRNASDAGYGDLAAQDIKAVGSFELNGHKAVDWNWGTETITANASGFGAISHGLGAVPSACIVIPASHFATTPTYLYDKANSSASVARIYMRNGDTNTAIASGQVRTVSWFAIR
jgi:hypothetical protein